MDESLWHPALTVALSAFELLDLADSHLLRAASAARSGAAEVQQFHEARAGYLRERLATIAPHLLVLHGGRHG
jgi:hypothetical protein